MEQTSLNTYHRFNTLYLPENPPNYTSKLGHFHGTFYAYKSGSSRTPITIYELYWLNPGCLGQSQTEKEIALVLVRPHGSPYFATIPNVST